MTDNQSIAIVIPAYKSLFLQEVIESVLCQNDNNFRVYIFNDASDDNHVESIIRSFGSDPKLSYHYFETNMGRQSLPCHWNRCIEQTGNEQWIWLFSDDDMMDEDCIQDFRQALKSRSATRLFRFNTVKFRDETLLKRNNLPQTISLSEWLILKLSYQFESYAVEYIFERSLYEQIGGFPDFPLGWCADDWFWLQAMQYTDLTTIPDSLVYWRYSDYNVSGCENTPRTALLKMQACCLFLEKMRSENVFEIDQNIEQWALRWINKQLTYLQSYLSKDDRSDFVKRITSLMPAASERCNPL